MKIGILSDTHGTLHQQFESELRTCDYIIHAGDFGTKKCYHKIKSLQVPLYMVRGNCDVGSWAAYLPETLAFSIGGHLFYLIHDRWSMPCGIESEFVISGHTHIYEETERGGTVYLNPGSATLPRGGSPSSMMVLNLAEDSRQVQKILLRA